MNIGHTNRKRGESEGNCLGCLSLILVAWLLFFGGCDRVNRLIDLKIEESEKNIQQVSDLERQNKVLKLKLERERLEEEMGAEASISEPLKNAPKLEFR